MKLTFDDALPISAKRDVIADAIAKHQVVIVAGETGSGKTTQLPKILATLGRGVDKRIGHTQPRRIAARSVAARIAAECEVELGAEVGYAVRFDDTTSAATRIKLMTDGILLAEINRDRLLSAYDTIIIDEAHERSLAIDFLLGYLKQLLPRRPDLKVVITSATIDLDRFSALFDGAPVIEVSGRTYPVELRYRPLSDRDGDDPLDAIGQAVDELGAESDGDILVFLSGEREIRDTAEFLKGRKLARTEILPLYGRLSAPEQQKIFASHSGRRIVLATNVAETSLTVPGIRYVIDPGLARISRYSQRLKVQRLPIEAISQASANQRSGRCGRTSDGICIRLFAEDDFDARPAFTDPEILRTNLASVLLQMASLDLGDIRAFPFLDPPDSRAIRDGVDLLRELGALRSKGSRLTGIGRQIANLPVDPRLARMLIAGAEAGCLSEVLVIVSAMSIQDPRERPLEAQQKADEQHKRFAQPESDFVSYLALWTYIREKRSELSGNRFRRMCRDEYLHYLRIREWHDVHSQLRQTARDMGLKANKSDAGPDEIHQALLTGLLSHVGLKETDGREYAGARNARFMLFPGSGLAKKTPRWVMSGELVETTRLWARTNAKIQPEWIEKAAPHLVKRSYSEPHWSKKRGSVMAQEKVTLYGLPVVVDRLVTFSSIDPVVSRQLFIRHALVQGEWQTQHHFFARNRDLLDHVESIEERTRRRDLRVDDETLFAFYDDRVPAEAVSARHFDTWWKKARHQTPDLLDFEKELLLRADAPGDIERDFPTEWRSESTSLPLTYTFEPGHVDDGVTIDVPIEQLTSLDGENFLGSVPGQRFELTIALIKSLPKSLRRNFVPAPQFAQKFVDSLSPEPGDFLDALRAFMRTFDGSLVARDDFDLAAVPDHLRATFRVLDGTTDLGRGKDLAELRERLEPHLRRDLDRRAKSIERDGITAWDFGPLPKRLDVGQATGYPALVDFGTFVGIRVLESGAQQAVAHTRGVSRLIALSTTSPVAAIGRNLDLRTKLLLSAGPFADAASVIEECHLAALDALVRPALAWNAEDFAHLRESARAVVFDLTEPAVHNAAKVVEKLKDIDTSGTSEAATDVRVQMSWLIYPGFIRDAGIEQLKRIPMYVEAAAKRLTSATKPALVETQELEARLADYTSGMNDLARMAPEVQQVRWALEELRLSLYAQHLRTAYTVSVKRVDKMLTDLGA
ncbi:MAG: hrpA [Nocardioidaceae bacterium]|nr:hrpA [Nocardioidaceae bacterium]